jgi:hypothetical protein
VFCRKTNKESILNYEVEKNKSERKKREWKENKKMVKRV